MRNKKLMIKVLMSIIGCMYKDLKLQGICFNKKDYKEAEKIRKEITDWVEELGLDK